MKLKKNEGLGESNIFRRKIILTWRYFTSKKFKIALICLIMVGIFLIGTLGGLIFGGFFGTIDHPSEKGRSLLRAIGIQSGSKAVLLGILGENIRMPYNMIRGLFSSPEKIYIDIKFKDYQQLLYKRDQVINNEVIFYSEEDYVPAVIKYKEKEYKTKLRLKGDTPQNLEGDKWSMRINIKNGESLFGMHSFSIQHPKIRLFLNELIFHQALKREDVIGLRYDFIEVIINGKNKGIFSIEEHFDTELIESNNKRDGVILKFSEENWYRDLLQYEEKNLQGRQSSPEELNNIFNIGNEKITLDPDYLISYLYGADLGFFESNIEVFNSEDVFSDPAKTDQFKIARNLLESFRNGELKTHEVFDMESLAKYFALTSLIGAEHGADWTNIRFYYNPVTSKIEPIGFNGYAGTDNYKIIHKYFPRCISLENYDCKSFNNNYYNLLFSDPIFLERYLKELERVSDKQYLDNLFEDLSPLLKEKIALLHKDMPYYHFSTDIFYENQEYVRKILNQEKDNIQIYYQGISPNKRSVVIEVANINHLPIEIDSVNYGSQLLEKEQERIILQPRQYSGPLKFNSFSFKIPSNLIENIDTSKLSVNYRVLGTSNAKAEIVSPWPYKEEGLLNNGIIRQNASLESSDFLNIDKVAKKITIKEGKWVLNKSIVIPSGYTLISVKGTTLDLKDGASILSYSPIQFKGEKNNPISIISSDNKGQGLIVLNAEGQSILDNVLFNGLSYPLKNGWALTGAVTFYNSPVKASNVIFSNIQAEDNLNIIKSNFELKGATFRDSLSDCLDVDFSEGMIDTVSCNKCTNDCLDFSGSKATVKNVFGENLGDKGISVGEKSEIKASNILIKNSNIGVASKDQSSLSLENVSFEGCNYGFVAYQKKSEFGPANIIAEKANISAKKVHMIEKKSELILNGKIILGTEKGVYESIYPGES
ncbi:MAG: hypothetical protein Q7S27_06715 [Nanoarchaeota archaeon]|nr:hypothetical protein [Nanoarchaeota archaeon]